MGSFSDTMDACKINQRSHLTYTSVYDSNEYYNEIDIEIKFAWFDCGLAVLSVSQE